jgi:hypothetical protein
VSNFVDTRVCPKCEVRRNLCGFYADTWNTCKVCRLDKSAIYNARRDRSKDEGDKRMSLRLLEIEKSLRGKKIKEEKIPAALRDQVSYTDRSPKDRVSLDSLFDKHILMKTGDMTPDERNEGEKIIQTLVPPFSTMRRLYWRTDRKMPVLKPSKVPVPPKTSHSEKIDYPITVNVPDTGAEISKLLVAQLANMMKTIEAIRTENTGLSVRNGILEYQNSILETKVVELEEKIAVLKAEVERLSVENTNIMTDLDRATSVGTNVSSQSKPDDRHGRSDFWRETVTSVLTTDSKE